MLGFPVGGNDGPNPASLCQYTMMDYEEVSNYGIWNNILTPSEKAMAESHFDVLIVGGGVGGVAAALAASESGLRVVLTEEHAWIGGQLTSQGVPPDEYPWIERISPTKLYWDFRRRVRHYYEDHFPLLKEARGTAFNPGGGFVSGLCHEPRIAHSVLQDMLSASVAAGHLTVLTRRKPIAASLDYSTVRAIHLLNLETGEREFISARIFIDCTELGELLPLTNTEYVSGAESRSETGELHASEAADTEDVQGLTWCFAAAYDPAINHIIERPATFEFWKSYVPDVQPPWPGALINWTAVSPITLQPRTFDLFAKPEFPYNSLWNYRKIVSEEFLRVKSDDVTLVNWPQNDFFTNNIIDKSNDFVAAALEESKQLSLSLLYWMQTEAPRPDGGTGYPGLYLAPDVLGTADGFAMAPYIRESRRIKAITTVTEEHVGTEMRRAEGFETAHQFADSIGIGCYRIDLHPTPAGNNFVDISSLPFQIPLGALIPRETKNLLAGNKNIGTTHITNGCYRLHPVEWNIGESAGRLAAFALRNNVELRAVMEIGELLGDYQSSLRSAGVELEWPEDIRTIAR
jgi:hypothetical protein